MFRYKIKRVRSNNVERPKKEDKKQIETVSEVKADKSFKKKTYKKQTGEEE